MSEMSPLAKVLMLVLRGGSIASVALLVLFAGILVYQRITPEGHLVMSRQDLSVLGLLAVLLALASYLIRSISNEINRQ